MCRLPPVVRKIVVTLPALQAGIHDASRQGWPYGTVAAITPNKLYLIVKKDILV
jgi:hypothetical protein